MEVFLVFRNHLPNKTENERVLFLESLSEAETDEMFVEVI
jgi:hypothetical protein